MNHSSPDEPARVYDVAFIAASFQEVAIDVVRGEQTEFLSRWYQAARGDADLTIWWDSEKRVVKQQLCLFGQIIEWNPISGTRTGLVVEHESDASDASEIIHYDARSERVTVEQAVALLREVTVIPEADRALLVYNFRASPKLHKNARERALKAWAPQSEEFLASGSSSERPGLWKRLGRWVLGK